MRDDHDPVAAGGFWYLAARLADGRSRLLVDEIAVLRSAVALARARWDFDIDTAVVLPASIAMIWRLPAGDGDIARRWRLIRSAFGRQSAPAGRGTAPVGRGIWSGGPDIRPIADTGALALYRHLCLTAPIRAGLVARAGDWPHSSANRAGRAALSPPLRAARPPLVAVH